MILSILLHLALMLAPQIFSIPNPQSLTASVVIEAPGSSMSFAALDLGSTASAGDIIAIGISSANGMTMGDSFPASICDSTTNAACSVSASTYSILTSSCGTNVGFYRCSTIAYTCNAAANVRYFTINMVGTGDLGITVYDVKHPAAFTSSCLDAQASGVSAGSGNSLTSSAYTTTNQFDFALSVVADDDSCGLIWIPRSAGQNGFSLGPLWPDCGSMLIASQYALLPTIQTAVTNTFVLGNADSHIDTLALATFK